MRLAWNIRRIVGAALLCFVVGTAGIVLMAQQGLLDSQLVPVDLEKTVDAAKLEAFSISTDIADLSVVKSKSNELKIRLTGHVSETNVAHTEIDVTEKEGGTALQAVVRTGKQYQVGIDVTQIYHDIKQGFNNDLKVVVELPEKTYRSLEAKSNTGEITLPALRAEMLKVGTDTGDITLEGFEGKRLSGQSDTGTMRLRQVAAGVDLDTDTGDMVLGLTTLIGDVNLQSDTGDMEITVASGASLTVDFASETGRVSASAGSGVLDYESKEKHKLRGKLGRGGPLIRARTDTGSIELSVR